MAADPRGDSDWESVLSNNIQASYNVFEASRLAGVGRIVYASSILVSSGNRTYCSRGDIAKLTEACIQADETVKCEIFYGMSNKRYLWTDISNAETVLEFAPDDDDRRFHV